MTLKSDLNLQEVVSIFAISSLQSYTAMRVSLQCILCYVVLFNTTLNTSYIYINFATSYESYNHSNNVLVCNYQIQQV